MTKAVEINGKQEKVFILQTWHLAVLLISLIFFAGGSYGISQYRIGQIEKKEAEDFGRVTAWIEEHQNYTLEIQGKRDEQISELKIITLLIAQKMGIPRSELEGYKNK